MEIRRMNRARLSILIAVSLLAAGARAAEAKSSTAVASELSYPPIDDRNAARRWIDRIDRFPVAHIAALRDRYAIAVASAQPAEASHHWEVQLWLEALAPSFATSLGGRSAQIDLDVRCDLVQARPKSMRLYEGKGQTGASRDLTLTQAWLRAESGPYLGAVITYVCKHDRPSSAPAVLAPAGVAAAREKPSVAQGRYEAAPDPNRDAADAPFDVQLGAYASQGALDRAWASLSGRRPALTTMVHLGARANVGGRVVWRLLVSGFPTAEAAITYCQALKKNKLDCFVRSNLNQ
jgi:hypothetical protein